LSRIVTSPESAPPKTTSMPGSMPARSKSGANGETVPT
jgi:hypothetical protein